MLDRSHVTPSRRELAQVAKGCSVWPKWPTSRCCLMQKKKKRHQEASLMSCMSGDGPLGWRTLGGMDNYEKKIITITLIVELTFPKKKTIVH